MRSIDYRPEIDGLRAVAVLGVILFHFSQRTLPSGFMGVDIFFVISGYLITSILLRENERANISLSYFWARRVRRILPALSVMVVASLLATLVIGLPTLINDGGKQAVAASACVSNYRMLTLVSDYWSPHADRLLFLHTWSLAVEEQFYLFYPLALSLGLAMVGRRFIRPALWLMSAVSLSWCCWQTAGAQAKAFFLMPARAWELLIGALIVLGEPALAGMTTLARQAVAWAGAALLLGSMFLPGNLSSFPWPLALLPALGTAAFIACGDSKSGPGMWLSRGAVVNIGKASYSLYLWHWPCLVLGGVLATAAEKPYLREIFVLAGIALGFLSWRWVEPLGRREMYVTRLAPASFACMAILAVFCAYKAPSYGPDDYVSEGWKGEPYDARLLPKMGGVALGVAAGTDKPADIILLGDSHALSLAPALDAYMKAHDLSGEVFASGGARLVVWKPDRHEMPAEQRRLFEQVRLHALLASRPRYILLSAKWENFSEGKGLAAVSTYVDELRARCPSSHIILIGQPPRLNQGDIKLDEWLNLRRRLGIGDDTLPANVGGDAFAAAETFLRGIAADKPGVTYISASAIFPIQNGRVGTRGAAGRLLYKDDNHLAQAGAEMVVEYVAQASGIERK